MSGDIPRISVMVITYNQEDVIRRTLDSLLRQKEWLYEICINDDCSTDRTWEILQEYASCWPDLVKPVRNDHNLGIFENTETVWKRPAGDLVYDLAGDDECGDGFFREVIAFIRNKGIDWKNELFCVYGDYRMINPDGSSIVYRQKLVNDHNALKLKTRKLLSTRAACFSKKVLDKFEPVSQGRSYNAELAQDCQLQLFSEHNYYIPVVGNVYYARIGVSASMSGDDAWQNVFGAFDRYLDFLGSHGVTLDSRDIAFIDYMKAYRGGDVKRMAIKYLQGIDFSLGLEGLQLRRVFFVLFHRLLKKKK